jgi:arylsulfatase A-like enzyme
MKLNLSLKLLAALAWTTGLQAADQPNVLFIITDDMYPWQMNFMPEGRGQNYTPNLDRLATEGTIMRNQYVASTVCTPSRYNVLTGRYASRAQDPRFVADLERKGQPHVQWNTYIDPTRERTLANHLSDAGYRTGFVGKDHVVYVPDREHIGLSADPEDPKIQARMKHNAEVNEMALKNAGFEYVSRVYHNNPDFNGSRDLAVHNQDWITEGAVEFIKQEDDRPFFLYFATTIPHGPTPPERSWNADKRATPEGWLKHPPKVQPDAASIARRACHEDVEGKETLIWLDDAIGVLLETLEANGELENTIIFFFNDHGQAAKGSVYQGGVYNPSIVWKENGWPVGAGSDALVSNIDFTPTILDLANAQPPDNVDGTSFLPILTGEKDSVRDSLFFEMGFSRAVLKDDVKYIALRYPPQIANMSIQQRQANLDEMNDNLRERGRPVHTEDPTMPFGHLMAIPGGHDAEQGAVNTYPHYYEPDQLYDLSSDPKERNNLIDDEAYSDEEKELKSLMQDYLQDLPGNFNL